MPVDCLFTERRLNKRRPAAQGDLCYDFSAMDAYLAQPEVRKALGVSDRPPWEACSPQVHSDMMADWAHRFDDLIPEMLEAGVRALV